MQDFAYFKSLYPAACRQMQLCVEEVCDEMEYEGSPIYDEYPDRIFLETLTKRALEKWKASEASGEETEKKLASASIQPHVPGNDVWYGPLRGEQQGENAGYTVWEADEPNLTAQERRPWSPPPGPRPGGPGNPWGPPPPPGPRPGGPGNPWGPPPPPPGPRPGGPGNPWGPPPPPPGPRPGRPGNSWGTPFQDFLQVLLMNELQERRRCRKC